MLNISPKSIDFDKLSSQEPLKFLFYYQENGEAIISNTIYLKDGNKPLKLYLKVFNDSSDVVTFKDPKYRSEESEESVGYYEEASSTNCHFHLRFEKDLGLTNEIQIEQSSDSDQWLFRCDEEEHFFSIYFLHKQELKLSQHDDITICFLNLTANNRTVKTSNVEVLYGEKALVWKGRDPKHIGDEISSRIAISVINHPRKTKIPLQFRVLGSNKILNDGTTKNTLILKVINSPLSNNEREILLLDQSSKFIVSFEQGDHPDALVAGTGQLNAVQIAVGDTNSWASEHTANTPQWSFTPTISQLIAGQGIELTISNLVTSSASGLACIYIDYQNIGSYPDGRLVIPIEKTPLLYSGENVGIGINNPQAKLHVNGGDAVISGKVGIGTTTPTAKLHVNGGNAVISGKVGIGTTNPNIHLAIGDNDTGLQQQGDGQLAIYTNNSERVRVNKKGNVGIGTDNPQAKLHVTGGDAVISGNVGIGTTGPKIHLAIGDNDTGLQQQGDGELAIYTDNFERVRVDNKGNVGIGTDNPQAKLHVGGNAVISGKVAIGTTTIHADTQLQVNGDIVLGKNENYKKFMFHTRPDENGDFLQITHDNQSGNWEWNEGIILKRGGNVGIGTSDPKAKLHVSGSGNVTGNLEVGGSLSFGSRNGQLLNLWSTDLGIGVQYNTLYFRTSDHFAWYKGGKHDDDPSKLNGATRLMVIKSNGNVGIGTSDPTAKLHVSGAIRVEDVRVWDGADQYDLTWCQRDNEYYHCITREGSSARYKRNIMRLEDDFQKILSLEPKVYQMREGHGNEDCWQFGYLAEELDAIGLRNLVVYDHSGQPDAIQYKKMCIYLNEVVKSQQSYLEQLDNRVNELQERNLVVYDDSGQPDAIQYKKMCIYLNEVVKSQQSYLERLENRVNELRELL